MEPPSLHSSFFSSLKRVEKRLKSEQALNATELNDSASSSSFSESQSLSTPLYLLSQHQINDDSDDSAPPQAFLSPSPQFLATSHQAPTAFDPQDASNSSAECNSSNTDDLGDIETLMKLLGLADFQPKSQEKLQRRQLGDDGDGEFYEKIVGLKGPKCEREVKRLDGWIEHLLNSNGGEGIEPLRLAHLLLGKAAFVYGGKNCDFGWLEFPNTIGEFLQSDPPR